MRCGSPQACRKYPSVHAIPNTCLQQGHCNFGTCVKGSTARCRQLGQTMYPLWRLDGARPSPASMIVHAPGGSVRVSTSSLGTDTLAPWTSTTASRGVSDTTRYHAPRRSGDSTVACKRAHCVSATGTLLWAPLIPCGKGGGQSTVGVQDASFPAPSIATGLTRHRRDAKSTPSTHPVYRREPCQIAVQ